MDFIELLKVIFLGIVEGITEWLPISSTGHMILVDEFLKLNVTEDFKNLFFVVIQLGAILAVVVLYWNKLWPFYIRPISKKQQAVLNRHGAVSRGILAFVEKFCDKEKWVLWFKIIVACIPKNVTNCSNTWQITRFVRLSTGQQDRRFIHNQNHRYNTFTTILYPFPAISASHHLICNMLRKS